MGFVIDKNFRSKGIGGLALEGTIDRVYQDFGVRPIVMGCHKDNGRAAVFYEKHGSAIPNDADTEHVEEKTP